MLENYFGIIEMVFSFGILIVFCVWQLIATEKTRKRLQDEQARKDKPDELSG